MGHLHRRTSLRATRLFPSRSLEFLACFEGSPCATGVCFAFGIRFLQGHPINPHQDTCKQDLIALQLLSAASVAKKSTYLRSKDRRKYNISFGKRQDFTTLDIPTLTATLNQWTTENSDQPTKIIVAISASKSAIHAKHFLPLAYIPTTATWEVGDTSFSLAADGSVVRYEILSERLEGYLNWQISDFVGDNTFRKISLIQLGD